MSDDFSVSSSLARTMTDPVGTTDAETIVAFVANKVSVFDGFSNGTFDMLTSSTVYEGKVALWPATTPGGRTPVSSE